MTTKEILIEYFSKWVSKTGLGRLSLSDTRPWSNESETVQNENGILFVSLFIATASTVWIDMHNYKDEMYATIFSLEREPGLFNRQPYGALVPPRLEAHDNYAAIVSMSVYYKFNFINEILSFGDSHGWNYNNISPEMPILSQQRQPGEIAFYKVCAGLTPAIWEWIYFLTGITINAFKSRENRGESQLCWLRLWAVSQVYIRSNILSSMFYAVRSLWTWKFKRKYGSLKEMFLGYFIQEHPIVKLSEFEYNGKIFI